MAKTAVAFLVKGRFTRLAALHKSGIDRVEALGFFFHLGELVLEPGHLRFWHR